MKPTAIGAIEKGARSKSDHDESASRVAKVGTYETSETQQFHDTAVFP
jgi:hypothetical protein